jgi:carboxypeptidase Taq
VSELLGWDERTKLPPAAGEYRAEQMALLAGLVHQKRTDPRFGEWLALLAGSPLANDSHSDQGATIRQLKRRYDKDVRLPQSLVEALVRATVLGQQAWVEARKNNDFAGFQQPLDNILRLTREKADALGSGPVYPQTKISRLRPGSLRPPGRRIHRLRVQPRADR